MLGVTLTTSATQGPCDQTLTMNLDAARFGRFWGIAGNRYTVSFCNSALDTRIYLTTNTAIPGVITCDDDGCGSVDGPSIASFVPSATTSYRVYVFNGQFGVLFPTPTNIEVQITCFTGTVPDNDDPCGAIALPEDGSPVEGDNEFATNSQAIIPGIGVPPSCTGAFYQGADLWYTAVVPPSGIVTVCTEEFSLCAGALQFYNATNCTGTFTQLPGTCSVTGFTGPDSPPAVTFDAFVAGLPPGVTIYIRHWERNGNENGTYAIRQCPEMVTAIPSMASVPFIRIDQRNEFVQLNTTGVSHVAIHDLNGRQVRSLGIAGAGTISIADLPAGIYLLNWTGKDSAHASRFVKL